MYMAEDGIKGLIYLEARACFSVHSGIRFSPPMRPGYEATDRRQSLGPEGGSPPAKRARLHQ